MAEPLRLDLPHDDFMHFGGPVEMHLDPSPMYDLPTIPAPRLVIVDIPRPRSLSCRVVDKGVEAALGSLLRVPEAREARRMLADKAITMCNEMSDEAQVAVATMIVVGAGTYVAMNHKEIVDKLGDSTFSVPMPIGRLGVDGKLQIKVQLQDFKPAGGRLEYSYDRKLGGGDFSANTYYGQDAGSSRPSYGVFLRWSKSF